MRSVATDFGVNALPVTASSGRILAGIKPDGGAFRCPGLMLLGQRRFGWAGVIDGAAAVRTGVIGLGETGLKFQTLLGVEFS